MARFDPSKYRIDKTSYGQLNRLSSEHLAEVLENWSRIANQRVYRARKLDPNYSALLEYERGGKFGKSFVYKNRESMLNEAQRIKNVAGKLHAKNIRLESKELAQAYKEIEENINIPYNADHISESDFRRAFAIFKSGRGMAPQSVYEKIKNVVLRMTNRDLNSIVNLIYRLYDDLSEKYYSELENLVDNEWEEYETNDEDLPF